MYFQLCAKLCSQCDELFLIVEHSYLFVVATCRQNLCESDSIIQLPTQHYPTHQDA